MTVPSPTACSTGPAQAGRSLASDPTCGSPAAGPTTVRITDWSLHLSDAAALAAALAEHTTLPAAYLTAALDGAVPAERAHEVVGRKGLLYKEPATRLALCAVHRALGLPPGRPRTTIDPYTAVVVAANLNNVATIAELARTIRAGSGRDVSPLAAPNASSNVVASTLALWFRFGGPNLTICSGATAGLDAVRVAARLLRAGRAGRVVVVGVEPADEIATELHGRRGTGTVLRPAAACLVLAGHQSADGTDRTAGPKPAVATGAIVRDVTTKAPARRLGPDGFDPLARWGDCYGAQGVVGVALAVLLLAGGEPGPIDVTCADPVDGRRTVRIDDGGEASP